MKSRSLSGVCALAAVGRSRKREFPFSEGDKESLTAIVETPFRDELLNSGNFTEAPEPGLGVARIHIRLLDIVALAPVGRRSWASQVSDAKNECRQQVGSNRSNYGISGTGGLGLSFQAAALVQHHEHAGTCRSAEKMLQRMSANPAEHPVDFPVELFAQLGQPS